MSHIFPRHCHAALPEIAGGEGCFLVDRQGRRYLDGSGGAAVSCLGHGNARVRAAVAAQMEAVAFAHTGFFTSAPAEALAARLAGAAPGDLDRVYLVSGGSEAVEAAIKLARQYWLERGRGEKRHLIARRQSYHGNTLGALAAGGNAWRRAPFLPLLAEMHHIPPCYAYREQAEGESAEAYGLRAANALEAEILRLGPETVMAFIAEPVVGATLGAVPAVPGYFQRIREICDHYEVLLIFDEVMCGMGRTGHLFAAEGEGTAPDILTIAKGLGAGYQPIGAMLASRQIYAAVAGGSGAFQHGHTYIGHPVAAAAGLAVLEEIEAEGLVQAARTKGAQLQALLHARLGAEACVGDIRGRGLFLGVELVADRQSKAPFAPERKLAARVKAAAMEAGLICYPMSGTVDGERGDHVLLAPPFIISEAEMEMLVDRLGQAIEAALAECV